MESKTLTSLGWCTVYVSTVILWGVEMAQVGWISYWDFSFYVPVFPRVRWKPTRFQQLDVWPQGGSAPQLMHSRPSLNSEWAGIFLIGWATNSACMIVITTRANLNLQVSQLVTHWASTIDLNRKHNEDSYSCFIYFLLATDGLWVEDGHWVGDQGTWG